MNAKEAKAVLKILLKVDGGCPDCVNTCLKKFVKVFPDHRELTAEMATEEGFSNKDLLAVELDLDLLKKKREEE